MQEETRIRVIFYHLQKEFGEHPRTLAEGIKRLLEIVEKQSWEHSVSVDKLVKEYMES